MSSGWAVRYAGILGLLLLLASLFVGFWAAELLDGRVPLRRGVIGLMTTGLTMLGGDVAARKYGGAGRGMDRYRHGPSLRGMPVFALGVFLIIVSVLLPSR